MGQESRHRFTGPSASGSLTGPQARCWPQLWAHSGRLKWGRIFSQALTRVCWKDSVLWQLLDWGPQILSDVWLEATWAAPGCFTRASTQEEWEREKEREERENKTEVTVLSNLIMEATFTLITSAVFYLLETSHWVQPTFKGRGEHRA